MNSYSIIMAIKMMVNALYVIIPLSAIALVVIIAIAIKSLCSFKIESNLEKLSA